MKGNSLYAFNMLVMSKNMFDNYYNWLFTILFKLEQITDFSKRNAYQQRAYGFMSYIILLIIS